MKYCYRFNRLHANNEFAGVIITTECMSYLTKAANLNTHSLHSCEEANSLFMDQIIKWKYEENHLLYVFEYWISVCASVCMKNIFIWIAAEMPLKWIYICWCFILLYCYFNNLAEKKLWNRNEWSKRMSLSIESMSKEIIREQLL